jgi:hypothetical protein
MRWVNLALLVFMLTSLSVGATTVSDRDSRAAIHLQP